MNSTHDDDDENCLYNSNTNPFIVTGCLTSWFIVFFASMVTFAGVPEDMTIPYESKHYDAFSELETDTMTDTDKKQLACNYINETTDNDYHIIMSYSFEHGAFHYWGENNIPFSTLDSVAQLYAIENKCKSICVDYRGEIDKATEKMEETKKKQEECEKMLFESEPETTNSPFASFKKYNMKTSRASKNSSIIPEKCNHFRRVGSVNEWGGSNGKWINSINSESAKIWSNTATVNNISQPMTYSEWKSKLMIHSL